MRNKTVLIIFFLAALAVVATLALAENCAMQDLPYPALREQLQRAGQVLQVTGAAARPNSIV